MIKNIPNSVIHVIAGILEIKDIQKLSNKNLKLLILGYKNKGRGKKYFNKNIKLNIKILSWYISHILNNFEVVALDNLALDQLKIKRIIPEKQWSKIYNGDEGQYTFFIDLVNNKFAISSSEEELYDINNMDIDEMFNYIQSVRKERGLI